MDFFFFGGGGGWDGLWNDRSHLVYGFVQKISAANRRTFCNKTSFEVCTSFEDVPVVEFTMH